MVDLRFIVITLDGRRPIREVAKDLAASGLKGMEVLEEIGCVTGSVAADRLADLRAVEGVVTVEAQTDVDIGPPGEPETW